MFLRSISTVLVCAVLLAGAGAADTLRKVAVTAETNAAGYSLYNVADPVAISNASQVAFEANGDIFTGSKGTYRPVVKLLDRAPGGVFTELYTGSLRQNRKGDFVFVGNATYGQYGATRDGIFLRSTGKTYAVAFTGGKAPGGGVFKDLYQLSYYAPRISDAAGVAFYAATSGTGAPGGGLYFGKVVNGAVALQAVALVSGAAPDGGIFTTIEGGYSGRPWSVNAAGEVVFLAATSLTNYDQLFCWKNGAIVAIPNSEGTIDFTLNNAGQIAYFGNADSGNRSAIRLATTDGTSSQAIVTSGDLLPDGNYAAIYRGYNHLAMNEAGEIAFGATTYSDPNDGSPGSAIYVWSPDGIRTVAVSGPAPGGGIIDSLDYTQPILGNNGLVYFVTNVEPANEDRLFKHDKTTLTPILSVGDGLNGDVVDLIVMPNVAPESANQQPVNDRGELTFRVHFQNYQTGIYILTPPPFPPEITVPSSVAALVGQRFSYAIQASNFPTRYQAELDQDTKLPAGWTLSATGVLSGIPTAPGTYTINLHASNAGGVGDAQLTITVADVSGYKGTYSGLSMGTAGNGSGTRLVNVTVGAKGTFTASGNFGGVAFSAGGQIQPSGEIVFKTKTGQTVRLQLDLAQPHPSIPVTVEDASVPPHVLASFAVDSTPLRNATLSPSPLAGTYAYILPPDAALPTGSQYPAAPGYGTIKVAPTGGVTLVTYLADGTLPFIAKGTLTTTGQYRFALPKRAGTFLAGDFTLEEGAGDSVTGSVIWLRPGQGTASNIAVEGSRYRRPTGSGTLLTGPLSFRFTGGGITEPDAQAITLTTAADRPPNAIQFVPGGPLKKAVVTAASGILTGSFSASAPTLSKPGSYAFRGVFLQKQNRAEGFFKGPTGAGTFTVKQ